MTKKDIFRDIHVNQGDVPVICYRSGLLVYEEGFHQNRYVTKGWNGAGFTLNVLDSFPSHLPVRESSHHEVFDFEVNGVSLRWNWEYVGFEKRTDVHEFNDGSDLHGIVTLKNTIMPITVKIHTVIDGTAIMMRWLEITNESDAPMNLSHIAIMSGMLDSMTSSQDYIDEKDYIEKVYSIGYFDSAEWGHEGFFRWRELPKEIFTIVGRRIRGRFRHPAFMIRNNALGTIWFAQLGYSGGYSFEFDHHADSDCGVHMLGFRAMIDSENPTIVLRPNETIETPKLHIGMMNGDLDDIVNEMHSHVRQTVFTLPPARNLEGGWIVGGMGPERIMDVEASKHFVDSIAAVGGETFTIDAGWYCPLGKEISDWAKRCGDWDYDKERYPNGIEEVRDYAHSKGLLFGLWMDVERIGKMSKTFEEHPDWIVKPYEDCGEETMVDMTNPEALAFVENSIAHIIEDYKADFFRLDHNVRVWEMQFRTNPDGELREDGYLRYCQATYAMYERLRRRFPDVVFENCASGGGRTDLGFMANFTHTWVTDVAAAPRSIAILNGMTMVLPPEYVDKLASGMNSHKLASLDLIMRQTLFGRPTTNDYNCIGSEFNTQQIEFARHCYEDIYKGIIRPFAPTGKIFHHTPELYGAQPRGVAVLERSAEDSSVGVIGVFTLGGTNNKATIVYPKGIDLGAEYEVTFDNSRNTVKLTGYEMATNGLRITIGQNLASELIIYKKK